MKLYLLLIASVVTAAMLLSTAKADDDSTIIPTDCWFIPECQNVVCNLKINYLACTHSTIYDSLKAAYDRLMTCVDFMSICKDTLGNIIITHDTTSLPDSCPSPCKVHCN